MRPWKSTKCVKNSIFAQKENFDSEISDFWPKSIIFTKIGHRAWIWWFLQPWKAFFSPIIWFLVLKIVLFHQKIVILNSKIVLRTKKSLFYHILTSGTKFLASWNLFLTLSRIKNYVSDQNRRDSLIENWYYKFIWIVRKIN